MQTCGVNWIKTYDKSGGKWKILKITLEKKTQQEKLSIQKQNEISFLYIIPYVPDSNYLNEQKKN